MVIINLRSYLLNIKISFKLSINMQNAIIRSSCRKLFWFEYYTKVQQVYNSIIEQLLLEKVRNRIIAFTTIPS